LRLDLTSAERTALIDFLATHLDDLTDDLSDCKDHADPDLRTPDEELASADDMIALLYKLDPTPDTAYACTIYRNRILRK